MKTKTYRGFQAVVEYEDDALYVRVLHIDDVLVAKCERVSEVDGALKDLVDAYIEDCAELGKEPSKPFSGTFNVRVGPELHRRAAMAAAEDGQTLNAWIAASIQEKLDCSNLAARFDHVIDDARKEVALLRHVQAHASHPRTVSRHITYSSAMSIISTEALIESAGSTSDWGRLDG